MDKPDISQSRFLVRAFLHSTKQPRKRTTNTEAIALVVVYMVYITNGLCKKIVNKSIGSMIFMLTTKPFFINLDLLVNICLLIQYIYCYPSNYLLIINQAIYMSP